ncbi:MAG: hypothetical protein MRJ92_06335 [Nitrospira sp.]|nr:hypothetical protein [Nitrospira sp.]
MLRRRRPKIIPFTPLNIVDAIATIQPVIAESTVQQIIAGFSREQIVSIVTKQRIMTFSTEECIAADIALKFSSSAIPKQRVIALF